MFALRAIAAFVIAFLLTEGLPRVFYITIGERVLKAGGWVRGTQPPNSYAILTISVSVIAALVAGLLVALLMKRSRTLFALVCGLLLTAITIIRFRGVLFPPDYIDAWPVTLAPVIFIPLGAWLVDRKQKTAASQES